LSLTIAPAVAPNITDVALSKSVPVIVTEVPPVKGPATGAIWLIAGAVNMARLSKGSKARIRRVTVGRIDFREVRISPTRA
jgi:hypothetical protein